MFKRILSLKRILFEARAYSQTEFFEYIHNFSDDVSSLASTKKDLLTGMSESNTILFKIIELLNADVSSDTKSIDIIKLNGKENKRQRDEVINKIVTEISTLYSINLNDIKDYHEYLMSYISSYFKKGNLRQLEKHFINKTFDSLLRDFAYFKKYVQPSLVKKVITNIQKDINAKNLNRIISLVRKHQFEKDAENLNKELTKECNKIFENSEWVVYHPITELAFAKCAVSDYIDGKLVESEKHYVNLRWCTIRRRNEGPSNWSNYVINKKLILCIAIKKTIDGDTPSELDDTRLSVKFDPTDNKDFYYLTNPDVHRGTVGYLNEQKGKKEVIHILGDEVLSKIKNYIDNSLKEIDKIDIKQFRKDAIFYFETKDFKKLISLINKTEGLLLIPTAGGQIESINSFSFTLDTLYSNKDEYETDDFVNFIEKYFKDDLSQKSAYNNLYELSILAGFKENFKEVSKFISEIICSSRIYSLLLDKKSILQPIADDNTIKNNFNIFNEIVKAITAQDKDTFFKNIDLFNKIFSAFPKEPFFRSVTIQVIKTINSNQSDEYDDDTDGITYIENEIKQASIFLEILSEHFVKDDFNKEEQKILNKFLNNIVKTIDPATRTPKSASDDRHKKVILSYFFKMNFRYDFTKITESGKFLLNYISKDLDDIINIKGTKEDIDKIIEKCSIISDEDDAGYKYTLSLNSDLFISLFLNGSFEERIKNYLLDIIVTIIIGQISTNKFSPRFEQVLLKLTTFKDELSDKNKEDLIKSIVIIRHFNDNILSYYQMIKNIGAESHTLATINNLIFASIIKKIEEIIGHGDYSNITLNNINMYFSYIDARNISKSNLEKAEDILENEFFFKDDKYKTFIDNIHDKIVEILKLNGNTISNSMSEIKKFIKDYGDDTHLYLEMFKYDLRNKFFRPFLANKTEYDFVIPSTTASEEKIIKNALYFIADVSHNYSYQTEKKKKAFLILNKIISERSIDNTILSIKYKNVEDYNYAANIFNKELLYEGLKSGIIPLAKFKLFVKNNGGSLSIISLNDTLIPAYDECEKAIREYEEELEYW